MIKIIKSIKVQLIPNNKQITRLNDFSNSSRFAYNWAIEKQEENYNSGGKFISDCELRKYFTKYRNENIWLLKISNNVTKQAIKDACEAYKKFFKGQCRHPKFKDKKKSKLSFYQDSNKIKFTETHVKVEGFSFSKKQNKQKLNWIRIAENNRIPPNSKYYNPRITFDGLSWWLSVGIESKFSTNIPKNEGVGIDLGIKDLAICSDYNTYKNINKTNKVKKIKKKYKRVQKQISKKYLKNKKEGKYCKTKNIVKSENKLLKLNKKLTSIRHNYVHQTTSEIIKREPNFICIEDLNIGGMMKNRHLSKAIQEQNLYEFRRQIEYKSKHNNIKVIIADRFFPSSKLCSCCGNIKKDLNLSDRIYKCKCGNIIDRDYQASLNLKKYGENVLQSVV